MAAPTGIYHRLIKPLRDQRITSLIRGIDPEFISPWDKALTFEERLVPMQGLIAKTKRMAGQSIHGLDRFKHAYIVNGNTDYINIVSASAGQRLGWRKGDYSYYPHIASMLGREYHELDSPGELDDMIVSWPGYSLGDATELDFSRSCSVGRKHLDVAYLGLTKPITMDASDFETIGITFSKTLSIPYNRIAVMFSRSEIPTLTLMNKIGYVNIAGVNLASHLLDQIGLSYWWDTYGDRYEKICLENDLVATNCMLVAYSDGVRVGTAPYWKPHLG